jgi:hypothetical protein
MEAHRSRTVQNLRQGADPGRARPGQERQGISPINTLKGRRPRSASPQGLKRPASSLSGAKALEGRHEAHERIGDCEPAALPAQTPRRLMIRTGSSPDACTEACPQPCKRQSPRQDRSAAKSRGNGPQTGTEAQKSKPRHPRLYRPLNTLDRRGATPTKINRGE